MVEVDLLKKIEKAHLEVIEKNTKLREEFDKRTSILVEENDNLYSDINILNY